MMRVLSSTKLSVLLIVIFIIAQAVATFLPSDAASFQYVYSTIWFQAIILLIGINLILVLFKYKTYKKTHLFVLHVSIIVIIVGAGITEYLGFKGMIHMIDGQTKNSIIVTNKANPYDMKVEKLPFNIRLDKFVLNYYPGSEQPSSYDSFVTIIDNSSHSQFRYHIYMNHILTYKGYRFYQASYDPDGHGSILAVSYDPGMYVTYFGYILFIIGIVLTLFKTLKKPVFVSLVFFVIIQSLCFANHSFSFEISSYSKKSIILAKEFSKILVQHEGRIMPVDTLDLDLIRKLTGKNKLLNLNYNQIIVGMLAHPEEFKKLPLIKIGNAQIRRTLGVKSRYASFNKLTSKKNLVVIFKRVFDAMHTPDFKRTQVQRDWLKLNELIYVCYLIYSKNVFKLFPIPQSGQFNYTWFSPSGIDKLAKKNAVDKKLSKKYQQTFSNLLEALKNNNVGLLKRARKTIYLYQLKYSGAILPSKKKVELELLYNHLQIFPKLIWVYSIIGMMGIILGFIEILSGKQLNILTKSLLFFGLFAFAAHTFNMGLRWYVAGHAPWSDAYESIVFIAWAAVFSIFVFFKDSLIGLGSGLFVAGMFMLVAHLNSINPQITNIVPVLNSIWLIIHVAFSIVSYGFLSVAAIIGFLNLILIVINQKKPMNEKINQFNSVVYIYMLIGLALLSIGTIFGAIWANESWGAYWSWDPKETWSLISILVYAFAIHKGIMYKTGKHHIELPILAFLSYFFILMTYFGVNFYIAQGLHSYGRGSGSPFWFYIIISGMVLWFVFVFYCFLTSTKIGSRNK